MNNPNDTTEFLLFQAAARWFAVAKEEVADIAEQRPVTKLPFAPPAVLGIVSVRGRILTVLCPLALMETKPEKLSTVPVVIALCGDEQLALAADRCGEPVNITANEIHDDDAPMAATRRSFVYQGQRVTVFEPARLFSTALAGLDRRRRRTP